MTLEALRDRDPRQVGPYALLGRLGEGGMGVVYLGQGPDDTRVAVKLIHARMDAHADFRRRFAREVAAAKRVARFCTAPVLDADVEGDVAYLVTEYVEGPSLGEAVRRSGPLKGSELDGLAAAMAMALRAIHGAGVVHRDLKPANVLLSQVGPKVIDFGIAQLMDAEMSSAIVGTPSYMSPEQISGATIGPPSDIFSWGCTVAFAASGNAPFGTGSVPEILLRIINEAPALTGLTGPLRDLVAASLTKSPAERPTAQDLMDRLSGSGTIPPVEESEPVQESEPGRETTPPTRPPAQKRKLVAGVAAVVVAAAGVTAAIALPGQDDAPTTKTLSVKNPLTAQQNVPFYAPPEPAADKQARAWEKDRPADSELMAKLAKVPHAIRLAGTEAPVTVEETLARAGQGVPVFLINSMPGGDCVPADTDMNTYQNWLKGIAQRIGQARAAVILEPSSLVKTPGTKQCAMAGTAEQRYQDVRKAVAILKAGPNTAVYLDGGVELYPGAAEMAERLVGAGVDKADGFFVNATAHQVTEKAILYGKALSSCVGIQLTHGRKGCPDGLRPDPAKQPHFVVDTARNGKGSWSPKKGLYKDPQTWCNPPGRGVGPRPTTETNDELVDAYLWIARAGTSSGRCRRGTDGEKDPERGIVTPQAGEWWPELALERAKNAEPPLR